MTILIVDGVAKVYLREGVVKVVDREGNTEEEPVADLELLVVIGRRILLTSALMLTLASANIPVVFIDPRGATTATLYNTIQVGQTAIRAAQYRCIEANPCKLQRAQELIRSKLAGLRNLIRYELKYHREFRDDTMEYLLSVIDSSRINVDGVKDIEELRLVEAEGSKAAWTALSKLFPSHYAFTGRKPRGGDTINSAIDFAYAVLYGMLTKALVAAGLDPYAGFMHSHRPGRLSLVYDFSEIYKPLAIHAVLQASRIKKLKTFRASNHLTPYSIEAILRQLYHRLHVLTEKTYKRKNIWTHMLLEARRFQYALTRNLPYKPYKYTP